MIGSISTSTAGMMASAARLTASASNIANARTTGAVPQTPPSQPIPAGGRAPYQPIEVVQRDTVSGGPVANYRARLPSYELEHDPSSPDADERGWVAAPNVDFAQQVVSQIEALFAFKANATALRAADAAMKSVLDLKA